MNKKEKKNKDNKQSIKDKVLPALMLIFLGIASVSLILCYIFSRLMNNPHILESTYNLYSLIQKILLVIIISCSLINVILLFVIFVLTQKEDKYNDYVLVSKKDMENLQKEIKSLKKELKKKDCN